MAEVQCTRSQIMSPSTPPLLLFLMQANPLVDMVAIRLIHACSQYTTNFCAVTGLFQFHPLHTRIHRKQTVDEGPYLFAQHKWPIVGM